MIAMLIAAAGCSTSTGTSQSPSTTNATATSTGSTAGETTGATSEVSTASLETPDLFSARDLEQTADLSAATQITLVSGTDVTLTNEGVYVITGQVTDVSIVVAAEDAKVQIVLDGVTITNDDVPAILVETADKVFITSTTSENQLEVTGTYATGGETNLDAVIFSKADLTLNGLGTLTVISSQGNGISTKDDLVITGGTYDISASADGLEANDAILISNGTISIDSGKDALHSENADDATLGYILITGGTLNITAADDAIRANSSVQIDGGTISIATCFEGIEANFITINDGRITLFAKNDGINAVPKVSGDIGIVVNGGTIDMSIGSGDTDAFDSNGNITINGGTITIEATSPFDSDGTATLNGGDVTVNGTKISQIVQTHPGGGGPRR